MLDHASFPQNALDHTIHLPCFESEPIKDQAAAQVKFNRGLAIGHWSGTVKRDFETHNWWLSIRFGVRRCIGDVWESGRTLSSLQLLVLSRSEFFDRARTPID